MTSLVAMGELVVVDVVVVVDVIVGGPVIVAVNVNPTVEVIATAIRCCSGRTVAGMDHGHGIVHVQVHVNDHGFDHDHVHGHDHLPRRRLARAATHGDHSSCICASSNSQCVLQITEVL
jgi:hypothetical protein